jgi:arylsulfatase A-like enzyme/Flp pilus assembly protein TadD
MMLCFFTLLIFLGLGFFFDPAFIYPQRKEVSKLNVLLLTIDTLRADRLSCYGSQKPKTPDIDRLAERSVLFSNAFANTSTTLPSHANILLGCTPNYHGIHENLNFVVNRRLLTLAEHLKKFGYSTGAFVGAYPLDSRFGLSQGFDVYDDNYSRIHNVNLASLERKTEAVIEAAVDWLENRTSPWFLWIHCWDPHTPYDPPEPFKSQYAGFHYEGEIAYVDDCLGRFFEYLEENNLFDSSVVILTGDHGESLGQHGEETHGYFAYNSSLWIPLMISLPNTAPGRSDDYVSHIDIFPTVCEALGVEMPEALQGISLLPVLKGKNLPDRPIYFESLYPFYSRGWAPIRGVIFKEKKYIDSPIPELYDLREDFDELQNLAGVEKIDRFSSQLEDLIQDLTPAEQIDSIQEADRETREKLASLGYVSSGRVSVKQKKEFDARDDVKVLLPYINGINDSYRLYKNGQQEEGIRLIRNIIDERSDIDTAYIKLASIYQESGNIEEVIAILEQGLSVMPSNHELFIGYMKALISDQQYDKVIDSFEKTGLRESEYDPEVWNNLGTAYAGKGDLEMAIEAFEMGLSLDKNHPELYNNLANASFSLSLETKDPYVFTRSFEYYKKAIELDPGYPAPYYGLGHAYREEGNLGGAIYCWQKALELDPAFREAHFDLAFAYLKSGNKSSALNLFLDYKKLYDGLLIPEEKQQLDSLIEECKK